MPKDRNRLDSLASLTYLVKENKLEVDDGYNSSKPLIDKEYEIEFYNNLKSINDKNNYFTNKISTLGANSMNNEIRKIKSVENKRLTESKWPFYISPYSENSLLFNDRITEKKRTRYINIFTSNSIPFDEVNLYKCYYGKYPNKGCTRTYIIKDDKTDKIKILFLDVHHLLADTDYINKYNNLSDLHFCISKL